MGYAKNPAPSPKREFKRQVARFSFCVFVAISLLENFHSGLDVWERGRDFQYNRFKKYVAISLSTTVSKFSEKTRFYKITGAILFSFPIIRVEALCYSVNHGQYLFFV